MAASNLPDRQSLYVLQDGERGLEVVEDTKIPNAATFRVFKQDHTLANLLRTQLLEDKNVIFAGYKVPHPLEPYFLLKVQTNGSVTPSIAVKSACGIIINTVVNLQKRFEDQFRDKEFDLGGVEANTAQPFYSDAYADF
ncbi:DNA-directed RNA polymerase II core subunit [Serendipita sp. 396]|nr:DNA-directed RNA polymerase II core subunit [Serendipita sp. 396]KAG8782969.1 DNA-directed RNA polymerase II core subunit [Serendipita sp. 397]KAG8821351.1 DNA-directed RNA polymerase II core subunit [Serendipita sp. 401]KAG8828191.1 DNA-directed RNA polymerase II core subunit [Serendipita sp. 400]KAG8850894.1 DNA-directed RNA polymerase II core subunit [Serendipita sp. 411]KAG8867186.1 DNA-directed RNA polymerase II core subunit [Serendipita sp. 405]KAG9054563.1 DNA-directed RNA polymeras